MRKFYSYVLLAVGLLIGTNAWAELHDAPQQASDEAKVQINGGAWQYASTLKEAFDAVGEGQTGNIELLKSISVGTPITMPAAIPTDANKKGILPQYTGQNITLNLAGFNIEVPEDKYYVTPIRILKGSLVIEGSGTIHKPTTNTLTGEPDWYGGAIIAISGAQDKTASDWSVLTIGKDVTLLFDKEYDNNKVKKCKAIAITNFAGMGYTGDGKDAFCERFGDATTAVDPTSKSSQTDKYGYCTRTYKKVWTNGQGTKADISQKISENSTELPMECGALTSDKNGILQGCAFGVKVTIKGTIKGSYYGVHFHGNINQTPECMEGTTTRKNLPAPYFTYQYPYVKVEKTATISAANDGSCIGIYVAGYGVMDVEGSVSGATGIYMKSGDVVCKDANVWSTFTGTAQFNWGTNGDGGTHGAGGNAIVAETSDAYAGSMGVTLQGDTKVTGATGYAIYDQTTVSETVVNDVATYTSTNHITIEGGTIAGGDLGTIAITQGAVDATSISGGNVEGTTVQISNPTTSATVTIPTTDFIPEGNHTTVVEIGGKTVVVVSEGPAPTQPANTPWSTIAGLSNANNRPNVAWTKQETDAKIEDNKTIYLGELQITSGTAGNLQTLTIENGSCLNVNKLVMNDYAQIVVEAGGQLIVVGSQGIVADNNNNLLLKASESDGQAIFLIAPEVQSNKHPNATVQFISNSITDGDVYTKQRFGIPTYGKLDNMTTQFNNVDVRTVISKFIYGENRWEDFGWINFTTKQPNLDQMADPFDYYQMQHNATDNGTVVTMYGELYGNSSPVMVIRENSWNGYANSYMAPINGDVLLDLIPSTVEKSFQIYEASSEAGVKGRWRAATRLDMENINPMQAFLLKNTQDAANVTIDYARAVYAPMVPSYKPSNAGAPARYNALRDITKAKIIVNGENCRDQVVVAMGAQFSDEFDNGYDASKYMNDDMNMYVSANEKMAIFATDNLENTYVGFQSVNAGKYTIEFANVQGDDLTLIDHETGARVLMVEGNTYEFNADANSENDYRFEIVETAKVTTAIENTEAVKSAKGIYTITGQYLGEMNVWNTLPAGVYVVNGEKRVK